MNVLVTGASLVGCSVARLLKEHGHEPVLYELTPRPDYIRRYAGDVPVERGDVQDLALLIATMQRYQIDTVAHTVRAPVTGRHYTGIRANVDGALAVMEAAHLTGVQRMLFASTQGVYDFDRATKPLAEDDPYSESDHSYVASKVACERLLRALVVPYSMEFAILRFAQIYGHAAEGAGDPLGLVLQTAIADVMAGRPASIDPGLFDTNDLVYVKDVAQGVVLACEKPLKHRVYNLGSGRITGPAELAEAIRKVAPGVPVAVLSESKMDFRWNHTNPLDITRARTDLGYEPQYDIEKGVADSVSELSVK